MQQDLNTAMSSGLVTDGDFGPLTEAAVEAFQRRYKLTVEDIIDRVIVR